MTPSTMSTRPLGIEYIFSRGAAVFPDSRVGTYDGTSVHWSTFEQVAARVKRLASALGRLDVGAGDRVGTFCWNTQQHLEAYFAVPCMGAVLHTVNVRLFPDQIAYTLNHAGTRVVIVDASLLSVLLPVLPRAPGVERIVVVGPAGAAPDIEWHDYEQLLAAEEPAADWPLVDEHAASTLLYTTGTTGDPKGVAYSHRSVFLHALGECAADALAISEHDLVMPIAPMFHVNAWGLPYASWMSGADLLLPNRFMQADHLARVIAEHRPTFASAVPTIWNDIRLRDEQHPVDLSSFRMIACGGSAVPPHLIEHFQNHFGVELVQAWGMTENGLLTLARPPKGSDPAEALNYRSRAGRAVGGVEVRACGEDGAVLPADGESLGEIEVRGPWVATAYYRADDHDKFRDGWLRTGDVGTISRDGFVTITDRTKDVIKSGGEWISSVELESIVMSHPAVVEAAVIGVPDTKWQERPLVCLVPRDGQSVDLKELRAFVSERVVRWWVPERWCLIDAVPRTSVGKFDKKALRAMHASGSLAVQELRPPASAAHPVPAS